jgi:hypothetical protein
MTDNAAPRHGGQWRRCRRARVIMLAEKLMEDDAEDIVRAVVSAAKAGDPTAVSPGPQGAPDYILPDGFRHHQGPRHDCEGDGRR